MIQIPVWPLPYWATACLLCLVYLPVGWLGRKFYNCTGGHDEGPFVFGMVLLLIAALVYGFCPGFYFHLALKDVQWAYLEGK
jgi:hypothetical protein